MKTPLYFTILISLISFSQNNLPISISGYVKDFHSGEVLIGANVVIKELNVGCSTNNYGFFSFTVPSGLYTIEASYIGYDNNSTRIKKSINNLIFNLTTKSYMTEEIVVKAQREDANIKMLM